MANIAFAWMVDRVREVSLLDFEMKFMFDIMDRYTEGLQKIHTRKAEEKGSWLPWAPKTTRTRKVYRGWGVGPIKDSFDSQDFLSRMIGGRRIRTPGQYPLLDEEGNAVALTPGLTKEYIHPVSLTARSRIIRRPNTVSAGHFPRPRFKVRTCRRRGREEI